MPPLELIPMAPVTETDWLMLPHVEQPSLDQSHSVAVVHAIAKLPPRSLEVIEAVYYERLSYGQLGARLGVSKTHAWRLTRAALAELKDLLKNDPHITERLGL